MSSEKRLTTPLLDHRSINDDGGVDALEDRQWGRGDVWAEEEDGAAAAAAEEEDHEDKDGGLGLHGSVKYANRCRAYMSGRDVDVADAESAAEREHLSDWAQTLRRLFAKKERDRRRAEASRRALEAPGAGFHRARVELYESSNLDTPENEQTRRAEESRSGLGRMASIMVRWLLVLLIVAISVGCAVVIHESSRWGNHFSIWFMRYAYEKTKVCCCRAHHTTAVSK